MSYSSTKGGPYEWPTLRFLGGYLPGLEWIPISLHMLQINLYSVVIPRKRLSPLLGKTCVPLYN